MPVTDNRDGSTNLIEQRFSRENSIFDKLTNICAQAMETLPLDLSGSIAASRISTRQLSTHLLVSNLSPFFVDQVMKRWDRCGSNEIINYVAAAMKINEEEISNIDERIQNGDQKQNNECSSSDPMV